MSSRRTCRFNTSPGHGSRLRNPACVERREVAGILSFATFTVIRCGVPEFIVAGFWEGSQGATRMSQDEAKKNRRPLFERAPIRL